MPFFPTSGKMKPLGTPCAEDMEFGLFRGGVAVGWEGSLEFCMILYTITAMVALFNEGAQRELGRHHEAV